MYWQDFLALLANQEQLPTAASSQPLIIYVASTADTAVSSLLLVDPVVTSNSAAAVSSDQLSVSTPNSSTSEPADIAAGVVACPTKSVRPGCKKVYDRLNFCKFCHKCLKGKISKHLLNVHKDEIEVKNIVRERKGSQERRRLLGLLANEGNYLHNTTVLQRGHGPVVIARRDTKSKRDVMNYLPCEHCKRFYKKETLWRHYRVCSSRPQSVSTVSSGTAVDNPAAKPVRNQGIARGRLLLSSSVAGDSECELADLLTRMKEDAVKEIVLQDPLIRRFACLRMESLGGKNHQKLGDVYRVSQSVRTLARLLIETRKAQNETMTMNQLITPNNFDLVVQASKALSIEKEVPALNLARVLGHLLRHMTMVKSGQAIRSKDDEQLKEASDFRKLLDSEWNYRVNCVAVKQLNVQKRLRLRPIPLTEDLLTVRNYVSKAMVECQSQLTRNPHPATWTRLAKLTMTRLITFNKRRRAEVKDLTVKQYTERPNWKEDSTGELAVALSPVDRVLAGR